MRLNVEMKVRIIRGVTLAVTALLMVVACGDAHAHAKLDHAQPGSGETVDTAPQEVTLSFTEKLEPAFSTVSVTDAAGKRVDDGNPHVSGNQMSVALRPGGKGTYHVDWRVLSVDTHRTNGSFSFQVGR
jgi:methionine-rich copper-binding protein CopC